MVKYIFCEGRVSEPFLFGMFDILYFTYIQAMVRKKVFLAITVSALVLGASGAGWLPHYMAEPGTNDVPVTLVKSGRTAATPKRVIDDPELTFMTLNAAHGGGGGVRQMIRWDKRIHASIEKIGRFIGKHQPEVVALQEADGPSVWSADFNHVVSLARHSGLTHTALGTHVDGLQLNYGTALMGKSLGDARSHTFAPNPPLFTKGYLSARVPWEAVRGGGIRVVSVHLDFLRAEVRSDQVNEMIGNLSDVEEPLVILGDFNCEWEDGKSAVARLADGLGLEAYRPKSDGLKTFPSRGKRFDWILISPRLTFRNYRVEDCAHTDHSAVIATLGASDQ